MSKKKKKTGFKQIYDFVLGCVHGRSGLHAACVRAPLLGSLLLFK